LLPDNNSNPSVETNDTKIDSNISQKEDQYISGLYMFLDKDISIEFNNIQKDLDTQVLSIINNLPALNILYKKSLSFLPDLQDKLKKNDISLDFQYIVLLN
jgi:phospholipid N-methyltransferase